MGYGRAEATLAKRVITCGHSLVTIDNDPDSFRKPPRDFEGQKITGEGYNCDTQRQVGIEDAYGFATVADDDNVDILVARIAHETYGVKKVAARIMDPRRAEVYERLGIPIVGTVDRAAQSLLPRVLPLDSETVFVRDTGKLVLCHTLLETSWVGYTVAETQQMPGVRVAYVL